jgi:hypothetical protein
LLAMVRVPADPEPEAEPLEVDELVVEMDIVPVVEEFETIGMTTKNAAEMMSTTAAKPTRADMPGRFLSKRAHPRFA